MDATIQCKKDTLFVSDDFISYGNAKFSTSNVYMFTVLGAFSRKLHIHYDDQTLEIPLGKGVEEQLQPLVSEMTDQIAVNLDRYFKNNHSSEELADFIKLHKFDQISSMKKTMIPCFDYLKRIIGPDEKLNVLSFNPAKQVLIAGSLMSDMPGKDQITGAVALTDKRVISCFSGQFMGKTVDRFQEIVIDELIKLIQFGNGSVIIQSPNQNINLLVDFDGVINSRPLKRTFLKQFPIKA